MMSPLIRGLSPQVARALQSFRLRQIPLACAVLFAPAYAATARADEAPVEIETITVNASPLGSTADQLVQPVEVISGEELDRKRRGTIGETLEQEPGVATTDFGAGAGRPVIRGQAGPRVQVLENGLASMDASDVSTDHAVTIDPAHATQVEVLKGPATLLYGSGASAGVVNVVDERLPQSVTEGVHVSGEGLYGSNADERSGNAEVGYGVGHHQFRADYATRKADDYDIPGSANTDGSGSHGTLANSASESRSGAFSYGYVTDAGSSLSGSVSRYTTTYGLPVEETAFIDMDQTRYDLQGIVLNPLPGIASVKLRSGYVDYEHTEFEAPGEPGTVFRNKQSQHRLEAVHVPVAGWRGVVGVQYNDRDFQAIGEEAFVPASQTRQLGLFVVEEKPWRLGKFELGARIERDSNEPVDTGERQYEDRDFTPFSLSAGSVLDLGEHYHLKVYFTHSQRSPVAEELYAYGPHGATGTFERGDAGLDMETANNVELGLDHHDGRLQWQANIYWQQAKDYIFQQEVDQGLNPDGSGTPQADGLPDRIGEGEEGFVFAPDGDLLLVDYRQGDAEFYGAEGQVRYALLQGPLQLDVSAFGDITRGRIKDGDNLPRITPARAGFAFDLARGATDANLSYTRVFSQSHLAALETPTDGYDLLSAELGYTFEPDPDSGKKTRLFLRGRNLLDEEIRRSTSFLKDVAPAPGVSVLAGLSFEF